MAKGGGLEIGATKRGKGMKIMAIVDRHGLPLSVSTHAANHHEVRLVQLCFASAGSSFVGSTTPTISSALSNLPASLSSSNDFEIGSREVLLSGGARVANLFSICLTSSSGRALQFEFRQTVNVRCGEFP